MHIEKNGIIVKTLFDGEQDAADIIVSLIADRVSAEKEQDDLENYSGHFKLRIPKGLHRSLTEHAGREGISMNQHCVYLLSKNDVALAK